jgi:lipoate-protein ligase A
MLGVKASFSKPSNIFVEGKKISGNAQSRRKGVIFHHGTILINSDLSFLKLVLDSQIKKQNSLKTTSNKSPVINLVDVVSDRVKIKDIRAVLIRGIEKCFKVELMEGNLTEKEKKIAKKLYINKYSKRHWNFSR